MYSDFMTRIASRFLLSLGSAAILTFIYHFYTYGERYVDWEVSFKFAVLFTMLLTARSIVKDKLNNKNQ